MNRFALVFALGLVACPEKKHVELKPGDLVRGAAQYKSRCALCHGMTGAGDGPMAGTLSVKPRNLGDPMWQVNETDAALDEIITKGGKAVGKSELMPANFENDPQALADVRAYVRSLLHGPGHGH